MIEPRHPALPVSRQCTLVGISRSAWYGPRKGENPLNLGLMRLIDAQFLETPWYGPAPNWWPGSNLMHGGLGGHG
jgi:putative transposase